MGSELLNCFRRTYSIVRLSQEAVDSTRSRSEVEFIKHLTGTVCHQILAVNYDSMRAIAGEGNTQKYESRFRVVCSGLDWYRAFGK